MNNFAIRYEERKRGREGRAGRMKRKQSEREGGGEREKGRTVAKIGEEEEGEERKGVGWLSECDLGREFTMQYQ